MQKMTQEMDGFRVVITGEIDQLCNETIDKKLIQYDRVAKSFQ